MRTKQLFLILALLCAMVQGAWTDVSTLYADGVFTGFTATSGTGDNYQNLVDGNNGSEMLCTHGDPSVVEFRRRLLGPLSTKRFREEAAAWRRPQRYLHAAIPPHAAQAAGGSTPAAATKKKQTEIKHFNINNKNEKDSAPDLWSLV